MFFSVIWEALAWILAKYAPFMSSSVFWDCMVCSVTRTVSRETSSSFAVIWIFTAVSGETPRPSWMAERSFSGRGDGDALGAGVKDGAGDGDGFCPGVTDGTGVFVGDGEADGTGVPVGSGISVGLGEPWVGTGVGTGVGVGSSVGVGTGVGWGDPVKVTTIV